MYVRDIRCIRVPTDALPTTTNGTCQLLQHTGFTRTISPTVPTDHDWWGIPVTWSLPIVDLIYGIQQGTAFAVTDGSYKDYMGTAAFTFRASPDDHRELTFVQMTPERPEELTPYRAEVGGIYGIMAFVNCLMRGRENSTGTLTVACDCLGALDRAFTEYPPTPKQPDFDLYSEIFRLRGNTNIKWRRRWVKGHQDRQGNIEALDHWAQINIEMDRLAKQHWIRLNLNRPRPFSLPTSEGTWSLWQQGQRVARWDRDTADQIYFNAQARAYWAQKYIYFQE